MQHHEAWHLLLHGAANRCAVLAQENADEPGMIGTICVYNSGPPLHLLVESTSGLPVDCTVSGSGKTTLDVRFGALPLQAARAHLERVKPSPYGV